METLMSRTGQRWHLLTEQPLPVQVLNVYPICLPNRYSPNVQEGTMSEFKSVQAEEGLESKILVSGYFSHYKRLKRFSLLLGTGLS